MGNNLDESLGITWQYGSVKCWSLGLIRIKKIIAINLNETLQKIKKHYEALLLPELDSPPESGHSENTGAKPIN